METYQQQLQSIKQDMETVMQNKKKDNVLETYRSQMAQVLIQTDDKMTEAELQKPMSLADLSKALERHITTFKTAAPSLPKEQADALMDRMITLNNALNGAMENSQKQ